MTKNKLKYYITADNTGFEKSMQSAAGMAKSAAKGIAVGFAATTAAIAASTTAVLAAAKASAVQAEEVQNLSRLAKLGTEDFRAYAFAFESVGVSQQKLADITKDFQDKLGDFIATGGGEFKDFFEQIAPKVGLTTQELQKMSGPEGLVAVKRAMDEANVSAEEQVFYLESIANDAALLSPLLKDNGQALGEQAKKARELGIALSDIDNKKLVELNQAARTLTSVFGGMVNKISADLAPAIVKTVGEFEKWWIINNKIITQDIAGFFNITVESLKTLAGWMGAVVERTKAWGEAFDRLDKKTTIIALREELGRANEELSKLEGKRLLGLFSGTEEEIEKARDKVNSLMELIADLEKPAQLFPEMAAQVGIYAASLGKAEKETKTFASSTKKATGEIQAAWEKTAFVSTKSSYSTFQTASQEMQDFANVTLEEIESIDSALEEFFSGVEETAAESTTSMSEGFESFATDAEYAFRQTLGEGLRGEFDNIGDAFNSLVDSMLNAFLGMVAEMAAKNIFSSLFGDSGSSVSGSSGSSGGVISNTLGKIPVVGGVLGGITGAFGFASGGVPGGLSDYRNSIVSTPTIFPFASGGAPNLGLMGEAGSEAIMPLERTPGGDLGVKMVWPNSGNDELTPTIEDNIAALETNIDTTIGLQDTTIGLQDITTGLFDATEINTETTNTLAEATSEVPSAIDRFGDKMDDAMGWVEAKAEEAAAAAKSAISAAKSMSVGQWAGVAVASAISPLLGMATYKYQSDKNSSYEKGIETLGELGSIGGLGMSSFQPSSRSTSGGLGSSNNGDSGGGYEASEGGGHGARGGGHEGDSEPGGIGGYASGGLVDALRVPRGEDGWAALQFGEGVVSRKGMETLDSINSGVVGGGQYVVQIFGKNLESVIDKVIVKREARGVAGRAYA